MTRSRLLVVACLLAVFIPATTPLLTSCTGQPGSPGAPGAPGAPGESGPSLSISPPALELEPGSTAKLEAHLTPPGEAIEWATTNPTIATVDAQGVVTARAPGTTFVTAQTASKKATAFAALLVHGPQRYPEITWTRDIEPLFRQADIWYPGAPACDSCHFSGNNNSAAEMELTSYSGLLAGSWGFTTPSNARSVLGESSPGALDFDWAKSILRRRLREHRMPPEMPFSVQGSGRDGPLIRLANDAGAAPAVDLLAAWVDAGVPETNTFPVTISSGTGLATFSTDILPLFTRQNVWYPGAPSCGFCHFQSYPRASAELRLLDYAGIMRGVRARTSPPGVSLFGESALGRGDFNWEKSILRMRLRDERMPPGMPFDRNGAWADGPLRIHPVTGKPIPAVELIGEWVSHGAKNN